MEAALRPHRGRTVLVLGILGLITAVWGLPLGIVAWLLGRKELRGMREGRIDPTGRAPTRIGYVCGIAGTLLCVLAIVTLALFGGTAVQMSVERLNSDGSKETKLYYSRAANDLGPAIVEWEYREAPGPKATLVKEGPAVHWTREHNKLEEGSYHDGKRDGPWSFWNEAGSIDKTRSGVYQNDVRVGPSPAGDYPVSESSIR